MSNLHLKISAYNGATYHGYTLDQGIPTNDIEAVSYIPADGPDNQRVTALLDWEDGDYGRDTPLYLNLNQPSLGWQEATDEPVAPGSVVPVHVAHVATTLDKAPRLEEGIADLMRSL